MNFYLSNFSSPFGTKITFYVCRFDDGTLRILESVLVSKDVRSFLEVRSSLREFMRSESLSVIREIAEKNVEHKILILDFFVRAFALAGDVEARNFYSALL